MKKLYPLLSVLFLNYWGCEDPKEEYDPTIEVMLWGVVYSIENTTELVLSGSWNDLGELTGSIPPEIGNLANLNNLDLHNNQLTGEIPESICDLNVNWSNSDLFSIYNNQLSPP